MFEVSFNNGVWEDTISFKIEASSKEEALVIALSQTPEYCLWTKFVI